jgi:hypothetical protein
MKDPNYYVAQAAHCRQLSQRTADRLTASRLDELAREYDALVNDLTRDNPERRKAEAAA